MGISVKNIVSSGINVERMNALRRQYPGIKFLDKRTSIQKSNVLPHSMPLRDTKKDANLAYILGRDGMFDYAQRINQTVRNGFARQF